MTGLGTAYGQIIFSYDGAGSTLATGVREYVKIPANCTLTGWHLTGSPAGNLTLDVWSDALTTPNPATDVTNADSIVGNGTKPSLSNTTYSASANLTNWTTTLVEDEWLAFEVESGNTTTKARLTLDVTFT